MRRFPSLLFALAVVAIALAGCSGGAAAPAAAPASQAAAGDRSAENPDEFSGGDTAQVPEAIASNAALIVHTGSIDLEVTDLRAAVDQATVLIADLGGQVAESHQQNASDYQSATVTFRIPAERWSEALAGLRGMGQKVLAEDTDAADVTAQVVDLDARITNLQASEAALQVIMARASSIPDVLKVQQELTSVRGDIESMTAQRDHLADQAALGTLQVNFSVPVAAAASASSGWDLGSEVDRAVAMLVRVSQGLASVAVWVLIVVLPVLVPLALILFVVLRVRRRVDARRSQQPVAPPM
jgi:hypothetical protein